ncbi:Rrt6p KNAG_0I00690 [Huiozyma naganishii CBS 8797]|uniref:GOLD domain-containing protein n=1 Tax=Huiozyma naganishii (strain ATCC MYA-139 / BCRC 22969 / CBS 8797 / KCTC 17520 / NBRC 10181 / NCYC 3082 / Yp74L-3) TaxID=1071383 RepID=J7RAF9_HUIN7|nr:hypothetical protein KNAG_0I00690 [Kazachstania naganishii CBS 8797]CCK71860.1 hypothetical protein KNAG_0I00690 [Kazachstania naganishii CBS 8797]
MLFLFLWFTLHIVLGFAFNPIKQQDAVLQFELPPVKNSLYLHSPNLNDKPFCVMINIDDYPWLDQEDILLQFDISNKVPSGINVDRFGGTSVSHGKQSVYFDIRSWPSGDLIRSKKRFDPQTPTSILIRATADRTIEICMINFVFDGSWSSIDLTKSVTVSLTSPLQLKQQLQYFLYRYVPSELPLTLIQCAADFGELVHVWDKGQLSMLERERRDLNESTFTWVLYSFIIFLVSITACNALIAWYIIAKIKRHRAL